MEGLEAEVAKLALQSDIDVTAVGALDKIVLKYRKAGIAVEVLGFNEASADMVDRFALHDKDERLAASAALH